MRVGIIGGSGYTGGEVLRLLLTHPEAEVTYVTSRSRIGEYVYRVHPNLRGFTRLRFSELNLSRIGDLCDAVVLALPHGVGLDLPPRLLEMGIKVVDLSANYRLRDPKDYEKYYGFTHPYPDLLEKRAYGLPELHRREIASASLVACPGCIATAAILSLAPAVRELYDGSRILAHVMIGSTAAGANPSRYTHHPERVGVVRPYKLTRHRHRAEIEQELGLLRRGVKVDFAAYAVDIVRGLMFGCQLPVEGLSKTRVWSAYRQMYGNEPFIMLLNDFKALYKLPDPKIAVGTNFCLIGFEANEEEGLLVVVAAIDNLVKGAAGNAIQSLNLMFGLDETTGLLQPGLHPV